MKYILQAIDIKKCFLLTGERGVRQVLGGRRRAHRPRRVGRRSRQRRVGVGEIRHRAPAATAPRRSSRGSPRPRAASAATSSTSSAASRAAMRALEAVVREELAEGGRGGREAAGNANAGAGELADHFAERRVLAADLVDVAHAQVVEGNDPRLLGSCVVSDLVAERVLRRAKSRGEAHDSTALRRRSSRGDAATQNNEPAAAGRAMRAAERGGSRRRVRTSACRRDARRPGSGRSIGIGGAGRARRRRGGAARPAPGAGSSPPAAACGTGPDAIP